MARTEARVKTSIWDDRDFVLLTAEGQRVYLFLISQADVSQCGVLALRVRRWARKLRVESVELTRTLTTLERFGFVAIDDDEEELLVRSFVRNDGVHKQPNILRAARRALGEVASDALKEVLRIELERLRAHHADEMADSAKGVLAEMIAELPEPSPKDEPEELEVDELPIGEASEETSGEPMPEPSEERVGKGFGEPFREPFAEGFAEGSGVGARGGGNPPVSGTQVRNSLRSSPPTSNTDDESDEPRSKGPRARPPEPPREDVVRICEALVEHRKALKCKLPAITEGWKREARRLFDLDKRPFDEALKVLAWSQNHHFWSSNIASIPKFREQYDKLRLQMENQGAAPGRTPHQPYRDPVDPSAYDEPF